MSYVGAGQNQYASFSISNYTFGNKSPKVEKERSVEARFQRIKQRYEQEGMRRSVDAVLLVHKNNTLHILILQVGNLFFKLPGGRLKPGEDEIAGLKRKLTSKMAPEKADDLIIPWTIGDCLGKFFRPNFETLMYPYCPPHIVRPKEQKKLFIVALPEKAFFAVPRNMKLIAVPLFELHEHSQRYGPVIASIPTLLSRLNFSLVGVERAPAHVPKPVPRAVPPPVAPATQPPGHAPPPQQQQQQHTPQQQQQPQGAPYQQGAPAHAMY